MMDDPLAPKPNAHQEAIAKLIQQYPDIKGRKLYSYYLDICPAYISQGTFEKYLAEVLAKKEDS